MDTQKLRQRILDLAIRGKLVPQDPNDEPASVLLDRIRAEKERLIAEGKIKRPKAKKSTDKSHYQQFTPPFPIPESWQWVRLENLIRVRSGENLNVRGLQSKDRFPIYGGNGINGYYDRSNVAKDTIIIGRVGFYCGSIHKTISKSWVTDNALIVDPYTVNINTDWLCLVLIWSNLRKTSNSTAQPVVSGKSIYPIYVPLPPKNEQNRIVNNFDVFIRAIGIIEKSKTSIQDLIKLAKSKILDLAMQGRLVPQDPTDEPADEMLRRINPKAKIITDNPQCRNLPLGWTLCQLRDLCSFLSRGKSPKYSETPNQYPVFAQKCNLKDGDISLSQARFLDEITISKWPDKYRLKEGDVLVNSTGTGTVGRTRLFKTEYLGHYPFVVPDSHVSVVRSLDDIDSTYIFYCIYCQEGQRHFAENLAGSTNQKELYIDVIGDMNIKLPPTNEQKRIVAKVNELYTVLDEIEASLRS